jgi:hypothetical protein
VRLAEALLEYETLDNSDIVAIIKGEPIEKKAAPVGADSQGKPVIEPVPDRAPLPQPQLINPTGKPAPA